MKRLLMFAAVGAIAVALLNWSTPENVITACRDSSFKIVSVDGKKYLVGADYGKPRLLKGDGSYVVRRIPCD